MEDKTYINFECKDTKTNHIYKERILTKDLFQFVNSNLNKKMVYLFKGLETLKC